MPQYSTEDLRSFIQTTKDIILPEAARSSATMLMETELKLLYVLARDHFRNEGHIIDAGCFLGGSTCALANGLLDNPRYRASPRKALIHSYDLFEVEPWTIGIYFSEGTKPKACFEQDYRRNITPFADLVDVRKGDIKDEPVFPDPIEILFIDIAKHYTTCDHVTRMFFPRLIPGQAIVVQQDYLWHDYTGWLPVTMEFFSDYFEIIGDTRINSVVFSYKKQIPERLLRRDIIASLSISEIDRLSERASSKYFDDAQKSVLAASRAQFIGILKRDRSWHKRWRYALGQWLRPSRPPTSA
jgi:hypothetical protein